jgi:hypothetical protein
MPAFDCRVLLRKAETIQFIDFLIKNPYINLISALDVASAQEMAANSLTVAVSSLIDIPRYIVLMITT